MPEEPKNPRETAERANSDAPGLKAAILQRILGRTESIVWRAVVELVDPEADVGLTDNRFRWEFKLVSSPPEFREWLGVDENPERDGEIWSSSFLPEHRREMHRRASRALLGGASRYEQEFPLRGRAGDIRWMHERVEIQSLGQRCWELAGMLSDISQRKQAEISLQESEARFRSVWEGSRDAMRLTDADGVMVAVNPAFCELVGMDELELIGQPLGVVMAAGENRDDSLKHYQRRFRSRHAGERRYERLVKLRSGREVHLECSLALIQGAGEEPLGLTILRDTTERVTGEQALRRSEAFFRSIWEGSSDGMRLTDEEGTIVAVNDAFCRIVNLPREQLVNLPFWEVYDTGESPAQMKNGYRRRCRDRDFGTRHHARVTLRSGEVRHLDLSISETEGEGTRRTFLTMFRDVTEAKQAEERRLQLERKMLDAQRLESLGILAGGVAHDFNNLLTAILGNASLAMMQLPASSPLRPFVEGIEKSSLEAADLCKQMLAYSGRGRMEFRCFLVNNLLEEMNHLLHVSIGKQIVLRFKLAPELPPIRAEPSEIQQVIMNLVTNASEAIGNGSGTITLSTGLVRADRSYLQETFLAPDLPEGDYISIEVGDTGCGMTPETRARIFDPFFTTKFTGRGLGLAAVLGILQRHKGAFKVYSEPNKGTTFRILLPAVEVQPDGPRELEAPRPWRAQGTILVVDDEQSVRAVAGRMLEACGLTVLLAKDGGEAVEVFRRYQDDLDLVLLDMTMPVMGGEEAFREIRRLKPEARVILMSGYTEADATDGFVGKGLAGFLQKPFKWEQLEEKLKAVLGDQQ